MLLNEIVSVDSEIDWFVGAMSSLFRKAAERITLEYENHGNIKVARMHSNGLLGKWFSENVIKRGTNSIETLVNRLKPHNIKIPSVLTVGSTKEKAEYSASANLLDLIVQLEREFKKKGYAQQAKRLSEIVTSYNLVVRRLVDFDKTNNQNDDQKSSKEQKSMIGNQTSQANELVQQIIGQLPSDIRHSVRTEVARQGNTLKVLQAVLKKHGYGM